MEIHMQCANIDYKEISFFKIFKSTALLDAGGGTDLSLDCALPDARSPPLFTDVEL